MQCSFILAEDHVDQVIQLIGTACSRLAGDHRVVIEGSELFVRGNVFSSISR